MENEKLRIDKYLWSIRIFKTRKLATEACQNGKVRFNGVPVKPSRQVFLGDRYEIRTPARKWIIEVTELARTRVDYQTSLQFYVDLTPEEVKQSKPASFSFYTGKRRSKQGRPTKKDKRRLDDFLDEI